MSDYITLSKETTEKIEYDRAHNTVNPYAFKDCDAVRRRSDPHDEQTLIRPAFVRDADKILNSAYYNRYADKTQVFSFYKNDDITRRALHVQLVSRTARTIGRALGLNTDLIEAAALGHDIGHTPFGHAGEKCLDIIYKEHTGRRFAHNIQSAEVLDRIYPYNITLQTLNAIICHNGETELEKYSPRPMDSFDEFDKAMNECLHDLSANLRLAPCTLEGCVVRVCDIISYLGKDRQDAKRAHLSIPERPERTVLGDTNAEIINNLITDIVEHSYGKNYIAMSPEYFSALGIVKKQNYELIYNNEKTVSVYEKDLLHMMTLLYERFEKDIKTENRSSPVFTHHIDNIEKDHYRKNHAGPYINTDRNDIVRDYIASMTDDYFTDLFAHLFPDEKTSVHYNGYFKD